MSESVPPPAATPAGPPAVELRGITKTFPGVVANRDVNLDVGQTVHVDAWGAEGECRVQYRGAAWSADSSTTLSSIVCPV